MRQEGCQGVRMSVCESSKAYVLELRIISYSCGLSVCVCAGIVFSFCMYVKMRY